MPSEPASRDLAPPAEGGVSIMALSARTCRWPLWEDHAPPAANKLYCGAPVLGAEVYCACHVERSGGLRHRPIVPPTNGQMVARGFGWHKLDARIVTGARGAGAPGVAAPEAPASALLAPTVRRAPQVGRRWMAPAPPAPDAPPEAPAADEAKPEPEAEAEAEAAEEVDGREGAETAGDASPPAPEPARSPLDAQMAYVLALYLCAALDEMRRQDVVPRIASIVREVAEFYGITPTELVSDRRAHRLVFPRQVAAYLARLMTKHSLPVIGRAMGGRDHTTIMFAARKIEAQRAISPMLDREICEIMHRLAERAA